MEPAKAVQELFAKWWAYFDFCVNSDVQAIVCRPLWTWVTVGLLGFGVLFILWVAARVISYKFKAANAWKAEQERRRIADEETMKLYTWDGEKAYQSNEKLENIQQRI